MKAGESSGREAVLAKMGNATFKSMIDEVHPSGFGLRGYEETNPVLRDDHRFLTSTLDE